MLSNARKISSRILRVSGRINGSSKFQIRSLSANKDAVQGPRTNRQQPGNDPDLLPTRWKLFGAVMTIVVACLTFYNQSKPVVRDIQSLLPSFLERSVVSTTALDTVVKYIYFLVHEKKNKSAPFWKEP